MTLYTKPKTEIFAQGAPESEIKPFDAWVRGLGIAFDETNGYPEMESFNGLLNALNQYIKYLEQNGFAEWRDDLEYPIGAGVRIGAIWYRAKTQNTNKTPATSTNEWEVFLNASEVKYSEPLYLSNGSLMIRTATDVRNGTVRFAMSTEINNKTNVSAVVNPSNVATIAQSTDLGSGQYWQNVTSSRNSGTTYTNNTGKPIIVNVYTVENGSYSKSISFYVGSLRVGYIDTSSSDDATISIVVPNNASYQIVLSGVTFGTNAFCAELR